MTRSGFLRQMIGTDGPHVGAHDESPYCEFMECVADDPNAVCDQVVQHKPKTPCGCGPETSCDTCDPPPDELACATDPDAKAPAYEPPPPHYDGGGIDGWAIVDAFGLDYYLGNAMKYIIRCGKKDIAPRLDDLRKAANYIAKAIEMEEKK